MPESAAKKNEEFQDKIDIKNFTHSELIEEIQKLGFPKFRANQLYHDIFVERKADFESMNVLPADLRTALAENYNNKSFNTYKIRKSKDGSIKFLFTLIDGNKIETVYMPRFADDGVTIDRITLCISTMAGCPAGCIFCATGNLGFQRNLTTAEMIGQVFAVEKEMQSKVNNIVLMGMGEPLLNYINVVKALSMITDPKSEMIGRKKITLSTLGIAPRIRQMALEERPVKLAISLHATTDSQRKKIMPMSQNSTLLKLLDAVEYYYKETKIPITYEYILFEGVNDTEDDVRRLTKIALRTPSRVNIIPFNDITITSAKGMPAELVPCSKARQNEFAESLRANDVVTIVRDSFGADIQAACGQLALNEKKRKYIENE